MNDFSLAVAKIEMWYQNPVEPVEPVLGAIGTGFFYRQNGQPYIITNWHNVTGLHAETQKPLHSKGLFPNLLRIYYKCWADRSNGVVTSAFFELPLYSNNQPKWYEHSSRNSVDVVAIPFTEPSEDWANTYINEVDQEHRLEPYAGMDCFILGFPKDLAGAAFTPIWKRGSIAAEPHDSQPFYIDSATRKGMSGAPVIARHSGVFRTEQGSWTGTDVIGTVERFVAIYSGRIGEDELGAQLGRAWQSTVLDDILTLSTIGEHSLNSAGSY